MAAPGGTLCGCLGGWGGVGLNEPCPWCKMLPEAVHGPTQVFLQEMPPNSKAWVLPPLHKTPPFQKHPQNPQCRATKPTFVV